MKVVIIEDEPFAYEKLALLLGRANKSIEIVGSAGSVDEAVNLIRRTNSIDLAFFDIQLSDGISFSIFDRIEINFPVIFTTAYETYAIRAFKHNSIDYLLKPIRYADLTAALEKYQEIWKPAARNYQMIKDMQNIDENKFKNRFMINVGEHIKIITTEEISCFYSLDKGTFVQTADDRNYVISYSLEDLMTRIDPKIFFRISRKYIVNLNYIKDMVSYTNSRLKVILQTHNEEDLIVSREKVKLFRKWLDG